MHTDVLIIGGGPTGLLAAALASQQNMAVCLVEQQDDPIRCNSHAHYLNAYSIEILVSIGIPYAQLVALSVDTERAKNMVVCHRLCQTIGQINLSDEPSYQQRFNQAGRYGAHLNVLATQLHTCLLELVKRLPIKILTSYRPIALDIAKRTVMIRHCQQQSTIEIKPNTILACDGASSTTAELADIPLQDQQRFMSFLTVECKGSIREIVEHEAMIYWIYHESMVACMVAFDLDQRQIMQIPLAGHQSHKQFDEKYLHKAFSAVCGVSEQDLDYKFKIHNRWQLKTGIRASAHKEYWLFLLGDACHQILPAGGLGLNTGFADAYNLIWKLKENQIHANRHWCVDTYEQERLPNAIKAMNQSIENYQSFLKMSAAITIGTSMRGLLTFDTMNDRWIRQQVIWLCRQYNESLNTQSQSLTQCLEEVKAHYDGTAMHHQVYYHSTLILNASSRRYYQLAQIEHNVRAGMRLLNRVCMIQNEKVFIHDLLNYSHWTLICQTSQKQADQVVTALKPIQVKTILVDKFLGECDRKETGSIQGLIIRPDCFVFAVINAEPNAWQSCVQSIERLMAAANKN